MEVLNTVSKIQHTAPIFFPQILWRNYQLIDNYKVELVILLETCLFTTTSTQTELHPA